MVIVQLKGGMGNQMFQYAAGKSLAMHHKVPLKLDLSHFQDPAHRKFALDVFSLDYQAADPAEVMALEPGTLVRKVRQRLKPAHLRTKYWEPHFHFDPNFFKAGPSVLLKGDWQSEKYFLPISNTIRKEFTLQPAFTEKLADQANRLASINSIAVHIRRGDYLLPHFVKYHGVLPPSYYTKAIKLMADMIPNCHICLFSDDINWVKEHIKIELPHEFISGSIAQTAMDDFYLMQKCRHQVIANSSFSWWAAWLNDFTGKKIIAPANWFSQAGHDTRDLYPPDWIRV
ncbi:alpha-1,2-fucosyltransferase [Flavihumibacter rivuli]|uniref:alpha-1,2-fucosyltransferase n=1 Tax=Flavihumibacter rivuli TaxID=2838156 RepID=UPI001BDF637D|nr:alpha-1,2-fucosyltransferase [Flavihumibacter rivuli]ULQ57419.1 alpha-1,2-fucosyltransferase [Flavihumibacter rivuli]